MKRTDMLKRSLGIALFMTIVLAGVQAEAAKITLTDGQVIAATSIRFRKTTGEYLVTSGTSELPFPKDKVKSVEVDKPAKFDEAVAAISSGQFDAAITILDDIILNYYMLTPWDAISMDMLGRCYARKPDPAKAASTYKKLLNSCSPAGISPDIQKRAWGALIAVKDPSLARELDNAIAKGTRENAAAAHLARADMAKADGSKDAAMLDYMRVILLYDQVKSLQAEALYKVAVLLEELRDQRADEFRKRLQAEWPQSEWAQKR